MLFDSFTKSVSGYTKGNVLTKIVD